MDRVALLKERFIGSFEKGVELMEEIQLVRKLIMCNIREQVLCELGRGSAS